MTATAIEQTEALRTWWQSDDEIDRSVAKLRKINDRAAKNGLTGGYTWKFGGERRTPVYDATGATMAVNGIPHFLQKGVPVPCPLIGYDRERELTVFGDAPQLGGWNFVALLTWDGGVLVTRCTPGFEGRIDDTLIREGECDHCRISRNRVDCYLLEDAAGARVQVGSSCVKDFLGHDFRPSWITYSGDLDEIDERGPRGHRDAYLLDVVTWAASICSQTGWVSREKAEIEHRTGSGAVLRECLFGSGKSGGEARRAYEPTDEHKAEAAVVLEWAKTIDPGGSEYLANVRRVAQVEWVTERNVAILGSAVASYRREQNDRIERESRPVSQFVGQVKDRLTLALTVRSDTAINGYYGVTHLYVLTDADGNCFKWFSSRSQSWEVGQEIKVKGTVKSHETYKDVKQTQLTRCTEI